MRLPISPLGNINKRLFFWLFWLKAESIKNKILLKSLFRNGANSGAWSHNKCLEGTYVTSYTIPAAVAYASRARSCLLSFATIATLCGPRALNKFILASINFLFKSLFIFFSSFILYIYYIKNFFKNQLIFFNGGKARLRSLSKRATISRATITLQTPYILLL